MTLEDCPIVLREKAAAVFGSTEDGDAWLSRPNMFLERKTPIGLIRNEGETGHKKVETLLGQIEYGTYS